MKKHILYGAFVAITFAVLFGTSNYAGASLFHAKCDSLALTSSVQESLSFKVPSGQLDKFNASVVSFLDEAGFTYETSRNSDYLSPPNAAGELARFLNVKTIGCTYRTIVWSENVVNENDVSITVHRTWLGSKTSTAQVATVLRQRLTAWQMPHGQQLAANSGSERRLHEADGTAR